MPRAVTERAARPGVTRFGNTYVFSWNAGAVRVEVRNLNDSRGTVNAEVKVDTNLPPEPGCLEWGSLNLMSVTTRSSWAKRLKEQLDFDWDGALLQVAHEVVRLQREGDPTVQLRQVQPRGQQKWLLWPFIELGGPTILYGDGGTGKSVLALCMCYSIAKGVTLLGTPKGPPVPCLYLDWETDAETHAERLRAIHNAYEFGGNLPDIRYKRMVGPLANSVERVKEEIDEIGIGFVTIDSLSLAGGGPLEESQTASSFLPAVRYLGVPPLLISHVTKVQARESSYRLDPFGSIFWRNNARVGWSVEALREEGEGTLVLRFQHTKSNNGMYMKQRGYQLQFDNAGAPGQEDLVGIRVSHLELTEVAEFAVKLPWAERIAHVLARGKMAASDIAEELCEAEKNTKAQLSKLKRKGLVINLPDHTWALKAHDD